MSPFVLHITPNEMPLNRKISFYLSAMSLAKIHNFHIIRSFVKSTAEMLKAMKSTLHRYQRNGGEKSDVKMDLWRKIMSKNVITFNCCHCSVEKALFDKNIVTMKCNVSGMHCTSTRCACWQRQRREEKDGKKTCCHTMKSRRKRIRMHRGYKSRKRIAFEIKIYEQRYIHYFALSFYPAIAFLLLLFLSTAHVCELWVRNGTIVYLSMCVCART